MSACESDFDIAGDGVHVSDFKAAGAPVGVSNKRTRKRCPLKQASSAALCVFLVVDSSMTMAPALDDKWAKTFATSTTYSGIVCAVVALVLIKWRLRALDDEPCDEDLEEQQRREHRLKHRSQQCGYLDYISDELFTFDKICNIDKGTVLNAIDVLRRLSKCVRDSTYLGEPYLDFLNNNDIAHPTTLIQIPNHMADMLVTGDTTAIRCIMLTKRINDRSLCVQNFPKHLHLRKYIQFQEARTFVDDTLEQQKGPLLELPKVRANQTPTLPSTCSKSSASTVTSNLQVRLRRRSKALWIFRLRTHRSCNMSKKMYQTSLMNRPSDVLDCASTQ